MSDVPFSWEVERTCMVCEDEVPEEHYMVGHLSTSLALAVCYECSARRDA